jgi:hypothetical protein
MVQAPGNTRHTLKMALTDNAVKLSYNCKKTIQISLERVCHMQTFFSQAKYFRSNFDRCTKCAPLYKTA